MGELGESYAEREVFFQVLVEFVAHAVGAHKGAGFGVALVVQLDLGLVRRHVSWGFEGEEIRRIAWARCATGCAACA